MRDEWVKDLKTGECWRLDHDPTKPVHLSELRGIIFRDGLATMSRYKFFPMCPKDAPKNEGIPETGEQMTIFDFIGEPEEDQDTGTEFDKAVALYTERGYRPRIAEALARRSLGMENPDAFLLNKFNITGEDLRK